MKTELELREDKYGFYFHADANREVLGGISEQVAAILLGLAEPVEL